MTTQPWLPIATAPQDGSWILLYDPSSYYKVYTGMWDASFEYSFKEHKHIGAWTNRVAASFAYEEYQQLHPTHWMPLPQTP